MSRYVLSPVVQESLKQIHKYSLENFGKRQTILYLKMLRDRMQYHTDSPARGKIRNDIKSGYYSHFDGSHTIYYCIRDTHIDIIDGYRQVKSN